MDHRMTPAPISVERLRELIATASHVDLIAAINEALPALLHQLAELEREVARLRDVMRDADAAFLAMLERAEAAESKLAERDAECERLKSARNECERQYQAKVEETIKEMARAEAAERAREFWDDDLAGYNYCGQRGRLVATPASGGPRDG